MHAIDLAEAKTARSMAQTRRAGEAKPSPAVFQLVEWAASYASANPPSAPYSAACCAGASSAADTFGGDIGRL
ncbi:hypothetical protein ACVWW1_001099 [Bradyrhizobium sp. JR3.5]